VKTSANALLSTQGNPSPFFPLVFYSPPGPAAKFYAPTFLHSFHLLVSVAPLVLPSPCQGMEAPRIFPFAFAETMTPLFHMMSGIPPGWGAWAGRFHSLWRIPTGSFFPPPRNGNLGRLSLFLLVMRYFSVRLRRPAPFFTLSLVEWRLNYFRDSRFLFLSLIRFSITWPSPLATVPHCRVILNPL